MKALQADQEKSWKILWNIDYHRCYINRENSLLDISKPNIIWYNSERRSAIDNSSEGRLKIMPEEIYGVADVPCANLDEDLLNVKSYVEGLEEFVLKCPTPMSIALQGDWGTGKTSFLQAMKSDFEAKGSGIKTIYFNTWQYSQFKMSENLYASFISNIVNALGESGKDEKVKESAKSIIKNVFKISSRLAKNAIKESINIDIDELEEEIAAKEMEKAQTIKSLKAEFADMVKKTKGEGGRVVIFVDDLDRLNPEIAVELLEVMKLFMDVPDCIFVLAIDYEVVVSGVRKKFGNDMSEEKCRSFFDKIIQLPFRMPVNSYNIEGMIRKILGQRINTYIKPVSVLVKNTLGANPRTLKRVANSFFLLQMVEKTMGGQEISKDERQSALLFVSLVAQMYCYDAYKELIECEDSEDVKKLLNDIENDSLESGAANGNRDEDADAAKLKDTLYFVGVAVKDIGAKANDKEDIYEKFTQALNLSSITSVSKLSDKEAVERKKAMKVNRVVIDGIEYSVKNPTYAQIKTYKIILEQNMQRISEFMEAYPRILTTRTEMENGFFKVKKPLDIMIGEQPLYIGTSSSSADKIIFTKALCSFMNVMPGSVMWYDDEQVVFIN